jgi:hypothetical protein
VNNRPIIIAFVAVAIGTAYAAISTAEWHWTAFARWGWLPGTLTGVLGGIWGAAMGFFAPRGRGRGIITACGILLLASCVGCLTGGLALLLMGRKWSVWYTWLLPGIFGCIVFGACLSVARLRYQKAEMRRISASDISST